MDHPNVLSLCTGISGLDEGLRLAVPHYRLVTAVEREAACLDVLVSAMEAGRLDSAPCHTNVSEFDGTPYRGRIDIFTAGFPCQPFSVAGKRLGTEDERHLFPHVSRIIDECRPRCVFLENVPGLITTRTLHHRRDLTDYLAEIDRAIEEESDPRARWYAQRTRDRLYRRLLREHGISALLYVCCELERLDFTVVSGIFSAEELGATQLRRRIFILAVANGRRARRQGPARSRVQPAGQSLPPASPDMGDTAEPGLQERGSPTDESGTLRQQGPATDRTDSGIPYWPPGPGDSAAWQYILERWPELAPAVADTELPSECWPEQPLPRGSESRQATDDRSEELADAGDVHADAGGYGTVPICGEQSDGSAVRGIRRSLADGPRERAGGLHSGFGGSSAPAAELDRSGEANELADAERPGASLDGEFRRDGGIEEYLPNGSEIPTEIEPELRQLADGHASILANRDISRSQALRLLGAAVVPTCAAVAFAVLATRLGIGTINNKGSLVLNL